MAKKLYITGAGASKDLNSKNLLGSELLEQIKNHRFYIYYWLIAMVVARASFSNKKKINYQNGISKKINDFTKNYKNLVSVDEFLDFLKQDTVICHDISIPDVLKQKITDVCFNVFSTSSSSSVIEILNFIFDFHEKNKFINEVGDYIIGSIILSNLIDNIKDTQIYSIDIIVNFLDTVTFYNDIFAKKHNLPKIKKLKKIATKIIPVFLFSSEAYGMNSPFTPKEKFQDECQNYIAIIEKDIFKNEYKHLDDKINQIDFINFNYDSYIEDYFFEEGYRFDKDQFYKSSNDRTKLISTKQREKAFKNIYNKTQESHIYGYYHSLEKAMKIDLVFCYEFLSILVNSNIPRELLIKDINLDEVDHYGIMLIKKFEQLIRNNQISLIRTKPSPDEITANFAKIENSDEIYILGFGFDEYNLQNIGLVDDNLLKIEKKTVYATNYGDLPRIRLVLERIFAVKLYKESELQEENGKKHSFWRSRDDATNKRGSNVFVSTKPVYRALTEDFLC